MIKEIGKLILLSDNEEHEFVLKGDAKNNLLYITQKDEVLKCFSLDDLVPDNVMQSITLRGV